MSILSKSLGIKIREKRKFIGLTQDQLAEMVGVEAPTVSRWEKGEFIPSEDKIDRLAEILHLKFDFSAESPQTDKKAELVLGIVGYLAVLDEEQLGNIVDLIEDMTGNSTGIVRTNKAL